MLSQFKKQGVLWISVEELKMRLKLLDSKTGKETFKTWTILANKDKQWLTSVERVAVTCPADDNSKKYASHPVG